MKLLLFTRAAGFRSLGIFTFRLPPLVQTITYASEQLKFQKNMFWDPEVCSFQMSVMASQLIENWTENLEFSFWCTKEPSETVLINPLLYVTGGMSRYLATGYWQNMQKQWEHVPCDVSPQNIQRRFDLFSHCWAPNHLETMVMFRYKE